VKFLQGQEDSFSRITSQLNSEGFADNQRAVQRTEMEVVGLADITQNLL